MSDLPIRTPLDVLLSDMSFWDNKSSALAAQLDALVIDAGNAESMRKAAELVAEFMAARKRAVEAAIACAPYMHSRVSPSAAPSTPPSAIDIATDAAILHSTADQNEAAKAYLRIMAAPAPPRIALEPSSAATPPEPEPEPEPSAAATPPEPEPSVAAPPPEPETPPLAPRSPTAPRPLRPSWRDPSDFEGSVDVYALGQFMHGHFPK